MLIILSEIIRPTSDSKAVKRLANWPRRSVVETDFDICLTIISAISDPFKRIIVARPKTSPSVPPKKIKKKKKTLIIILMEFWIDIYQESCAWRPNMAEYFVMYSNHNKTFAWD